MKKIAILLITGLFACANKDYIQSDVCSPSIDERSNIITKPSSMDDCGLVSSISIYDGISKKDHPFYFHKFVNQELFSDDVWSCTLAKEKSSSQDLIVISCNTQSIMDFHYASVVLSCDKQHTDTSAKETEYISIQAQCKCSDL